MGHLRPDPQRSGCDHSSGQVQPQSHAAFDPVQRLLRGGVAAQRMGHRVARAAQLAVDRQILTRGDQVDHAAARGLQRRLCPARRFAGKALTQNKNQAGQQRIAQTSHQRDHRMHQHPKRGRGQGDHRQSGQTRQHQPQRDPVQRVDIRRHPVEKGIGAQSLQRAVGAVQQPLQKLHAQARHRP